MAAGRLEAMDSVAVHVNEELGGLEQLEYLKVLTVPTRVNYVGKGANLHKAGYQLQGSAYVVNKLLAAPGCGTACASPAVATARYCSPRLL